MEPAFPRTLRNSQGRTRARLRLVVSFLLVMSGLIANARAADETLVINEVLITPQAGDRQFIEYLNRGEIDLDLFRWWICHQPSNRYYRLLQVPQGTGTPMTASIVLAPGDFLVTTWSLEAAGGYTTRPNSAGTTTHEVNINAFIPLFLFDPQSGNLSVWDQIPPDFPCFGEPNLIRDFVGWGADGAYVGAKRGCTAFAAGLWSPPVLLDCTDINNVAFAAGPRSPAKSRRNRPGRRCPRRPHNRIDIAPPPGARPRRPGRVPNTLPSLITNPPVEAGRPMTSRYIAQGHPSRSRTGNRWSTP